MGTPTLVKSYKAAGLTVTAEPSTAPYFVELNTATAPFNNITAREAIYYATDASLLDSKLFGDVYPLTQSFTTPSGLFYDPKVPGYRTYDLAKAKALVSQLGGLSFNLFTNATSTSQEFIEALQTLYVAAGMKVTVTQDTLATLVQTFESKSWQSSLEAYGSWDPAAEHGVSFGFSPPSPFTGVNSPTLTSLLNQAQAAANPSSRSSLYARAAEEMSKLATGPFLFPLATWNIAVKGVTGPGLTTDTIPIADVDPSILWEDVSMSAST
jgi:peptide/nickel transport system substrate-binding protein